MNEIQEKVVNIISEHLGASHEEITPTSHLQDDLNSDPLTLADIVVSLENEFKVEIPASDSQSFNKVGDIINFIADSLGEV
jgi:acyl carrier protein